MESFDIADLSIATGLLEIRGARTYAEVEVPLIRFRPESSTIPFSVQGSDLALLMHMPEWHTHSTFGNQNTAQFAKVGKLRLRGSYLYYAEPTPEHVECITLFIYVSMTLGTHAWSQMLITRFAARRRRLQNYWMGNPTPHAHQGQLCWILHEFSDNARFP